MSSLIDCVYNANDKLNIKLSATGDKLKVISTQDIPSVVELYRSVYQELAKANCGKFIHKMTSDDIEEIISKDDRTIVGYFKEGKHLAGTVYAKPFAKNSPFYQTPSYEGDKTTYAIGGLVVDPKYRGNGVVSKITCASVEGVKEYSSVDKTISGAGIEVSCENFGSLHSLGSAKDLQNKTIFNFAGIHYLENPETNDNDLTILGYTSFKQDEVTGLMLPSVTLNGHQGEAFVKLSETMEDIGSQSDGVDLTTIDGHNIETFSSYINAPIIDVIKYDPNYSSTYPPQLEQ